MGELNDDLYEIGFTPDLLPQRMAGGLSVGDRANFALEFYSPEPIRLVHNRAISAGPQLTRIGRATFNIVGRVIHARSHWWALDAGIRMFRAEAPPKLVREGSEVTGTCHVDVGTYWYEEHFSKEPDAPPLIYDWFIDRIEKDETPLIRAGRGWLERDKAQESWTDAAQTEPWTDAPCSQEFVIHCRRLGDAPKRSA